MEPATPPAPGPLSPWVIAEDAAGFLDFVAAVFGARELGRMPGPDGRIGHGETRIGDTTVVVMDAREGWDSTPTLLRLHVDDLDVVLERARAGGAEVVTPATLLAYGERCARVADPWGNLRWLHQRVEELDVTALLQRMQSPEALAVIAGFDDSLDQELRRRGSGGRVTPPA